MAYGNYLASVSPDQVRLLREGITRKLAPSKVVCITHLVAYGIKQQPLGVLLCQAVDGGEPLSFELWHPLRVPTYHEPPEAANLFRELSIAWRGALAGQPFRERDLFRPEIEKLLSVFECAARDKDGVVSVLEAPADAERANRVRIPFDVPHIDASYEGSSGKG